MTESRAPSTILNRWILFLALAGMILAVHLWVQKARGFDQGCLGLSKPTRVAYDGCREVGDLPASHLFGISNAAWGYAFYFGLAIVTFAKLLVSPSTARRLHLAGELAVAGAFAYSAYLVYVMASDVGRFCVLCLGSAACVSALVVLHVLIRRRGGYSAALESRRQLEFGVGVAAIFSGMGLMVAVLLFINRIGTRPLDQGTEGQEIEQAVRAALPMFIDSKHLAEMRACRFDRWEPVCDTAKVVSPDVPVLGKRGTSQVVAFYDPNCSICREHFPEFLALAEKYKDRASFVAVARPLWDKSLLEVAALKLAEPTGKYYQLWRKMFESPDEKGMNAEQIAALFRSLGLPADNMEERLASVRKTVINERDRMHAAGVNLLPAIYIDGRRVAQDNCSEGCVANLLQWQLEHGGEKRFPQ